MEVHRRDGIDFVTAIAGGSARQAAADTPGGCQSNSKAVLDQNAEDQKQPKELIGATSYTPLKRSFTVEPT